MLIIFVHMSETFWTSKSQSILKVKDIENFVVWNMSYMMVKFRNSPHSSGKPHIQLQIGFYIEKTQSWVKKVEGWIWEELAEWKWIWSKSVIWNPQRTIKNTSKRVFNFFLGPISISICWYICENEEGSKDWRQQDLFSRVEKSPLPSLSLLSFSVSLSLPGYDHFGNTLDVYHRKSNTYFDSAVVFLSYCQWRWVLMSTNICGQGNH